MKKLLQPISICVLGPFPFQSIKLVPWRYDTTAYVGGKSIQFSELEIFNIAWAKSMTQSGRLFALKFTTKSISPTTTLHQEKSMPTTSPQEKRASTSIPYNTVAPIALPKGKDVTNKVIKATSSKVK